MLFPFYRSSLAVNVSKELVYHYQISYQISYLQVGDQGNLLERLRLKFSTSLTQYASICVERWCDVCARRALTK